MGAHTPGTPPMTPQGKRPRFPWYKDERIAGSKHITAQISVRLLLIALAIFVVIVAYVGWYVVGKIEELDRDHVQVTNSERASKAARSEQLQQQQDEIAQNKLDSYNQVRDLACSVAAQFPPGQSPLIDGLRVKYLCPAYVKGSQAPVSPLPSIPPGSTGGQQSGGDTSTGVPKSPSAPRTTPQGAPAQPTPTPTSKATPTPSNTVHVTVPPTPTPLVNVPTLTCQLLGILC